MLGGNIMEKNNSVDKEVIELDRKIRHIENILNEFSKEQIINYLAIKIALEDYNINDFPIEIE